ncbi:basic phospholipase A2 PA-15-like [Scyliorhinus canicula]|uniref:basic phospholipase A2 PA-15-like n=1 Tax=Scyliorhinus canicula TaxID=7830 RepID=UPI0018F31A39|nr:basic phospholipase A2 PA-15-like [Scyliorhinus canicula]
MESPKLTAILIVLGAIWIPAHGFVDYRSITSVLRIVHCLNSTLLFPHYRKYGCFCRFGGNGNQPVDEIDRCCQVHEDCYREAGRTGCDGKLVWYHSTCENGIPQCADGAVMSHDAECVQKLCDCDIAAALCIKENNDKHNPKFVRYDQSLCKTVP